MRNQLFKLTVGISIALCAVITIAWITSYFHRISLVHQAQYDKVSLSINRGKTDLLWSNWEPLAPGEKMDPTPQFFGAIDWPEIGVLGGLRSKNKRFNALPRQQRNHHIPRMVSGDYRNTSGTQLVAVEPKAKDATEPLPGVRLRSSSHTRLLPGVWNANAIFIALNRLVDPTQESPRRCRGSWRHMRFEIPDFKLSEDTAAP